MAYVPTTKAIEIAHEMASKLTQRLNGSLTLTESFDTDGCPVISVGDGVAGDKNYVIKVVNTANSLATDSLGNALSSSIGNYGPEVVMIATEANYAGTTDNVADIFDLQTLLDAIGQCVASGCVVQWWQEANGTAPTVSTFNTGSKLKATRYPSLKFGVLSAQ